MLQTFTLLGYFIERIWAMVTRRVQGPYSLSPKARMTDDDGRRRVTWKIIVVIGLQMIH